MGVPATPLHALANAAVTHDWSNYTLEEFVESVPDFLVEHEDELVKLALKELDYVGELRVTREPSGT